MARKQTKAYQNLENRLKQIRGIKKNNRKPIVVNNPFESQKSNKKGKSNLQKSFAKNVKMLQRKSKNDKYNLEAQSSSDEEEKEGKAYTVIKKIKVESNNKKKTESKNQKNKNKNFHLGEQIKDINNDFKQLIGKLQKESDNNNQQDGYEKLVKTLAINQDIKLNLPKNHKKDNKPVTKSFVPPEILVIPNSYKDLLISLKKEKCNEIKVFDMFKKSQNKSQASKSIDLLIEYLSFHLDTNIQQNLTQQCSFIIKYLVDKYPETMNETLEKLIEKIKPNGIDPKYTNYQYLSMIIFKTICLCKDDNIIQLIKSSISNIISSNKILNPGNLQCAFGYCKLLKEFLAPKTNKPIFVPEILYSLEKMIEFIKHNINKIQTNENHDINFFIFENSSTINLKIVCLIFQFVLELMDDLSSICVNYLGVFKEIVADVNHIKPHILSNSTIENLIDNINSTFSKLQDCSSSLPEDNNNTKPKKKQIPSYEPLINY